MLVVFISTLWWNPACFVIVQTQVFHKQNTNVCNYVLRQIHQILLPQDMCVGENQFLLRPCNSLASSYDLSDLAHSNGVLCNNQRYFNAKYYNYYNAEGGKHFVQTVQSLTNQPNTYIIFGVGKF